MDNEKLLKRKYNTYNSVKKSPDYGRLYVSNLPWGTKRDDLIELFNTITTVRGVYMVYTKNRKFTGMAFISVDNADKAFILNGAMFGDRHMYIKKAKVNKKYMSKLRKVKNNENPRVKTARKNPKVNKSRVRGDSVQGGEGQHRRRPGFDDSNRRLWTFHDRGKKR